MFVDIEPETLASANRWANLLPTLAETRYAFAYIGWYRNGAQGLEPERGRLTRAQAQAIREKVDAMQLWSHVR